MTRAASHAVFLFTLLLFSNCVAPLHAKWVADFENLTPTIAYDGVGKGFYEDGRNLAGSFVTGNTVFRNYYTNEWGSPYWEGWSFSDTIDTFTGGHSNQHSAYALTGAHGRTTYGVAFSHATVELSAAPLGADITNTTYTALSMIYGDPFAKKFGGTSGDDADWLLLTVNGTDALGQATGSVGLYLADYRFGDPTMDYVVRDWTWMDLTGLGRETRRLNFSLSSSDNGAWGMNTPAYFALDNLTTVPEPSSVLLCSVACGLFLLGRRWTRKRAAE